MYEVIAAPPSEAGALKLTVACPLPGRRRHGGRRTRHRPRRHRSRGRRRGAVAGHVVRRDRERVARAVRQPGHDERAAGARRGLPVRRRGHRVRGDRRAAVGGRRGEATVAWPLPGVADTPVGAPGHGPRRHRGRRRPTRHAVAGRVVRRDRERVARAVRQAGHDERAAGARRGLPVRRRGHRVRGDRSPAVRRGRSEAHARLPIAGGGRHRRRLVRAPWATANTHAAPTSVLSWWPPIRAVFPSDDNAAT